jgi:hypothetical protein
MSQDHARLARDLYDHDHEDEHVGPSGRRRRPAADWGVGDEVFDQMPRRRFDRDHRPARPEVPRGGADDGRRTIRIGSDDDVPSEIAAVTADRDIDDELPAALEEPAAAAVEPVEAPAGDGGHGDDDPAAAPDRPVRRTVKIDGRPNGALRGARFHEGSGRGRYSRSASERIGARPERLAAWAFALGVLLILIAILS